MSIVGINYEKLKLASPETAREVLKYLEILENSGKPPVVASHQNWTNVVATLPGKTGLSGDPLEIQHRLRAEWDRS
ncbi:MAG: hypothetical protein ABL901_15325 [Hyphomicrobiaceae bacterium]